MTLKFYKPITPSLRFQVLLNRSNLNKGSLLKSSIKGLKNSSGRNHSGKISAYHKGSGAKRKYRLLCDNNLKNLNCIVLTLEHDPFRSANVASLYCFNEKTYFYILAPLYLEVGNIVRLNSTREPKLGHSLAIKDVSVGTFVHNVSSQPFSKGIYARAAGTFAIVLKKTEEFALLKLPSNKILRVKHSSTASIGVLSNPDFFLTVRGKAGRSRWLNVRPTVRGVAMNPVDHPHGGGEGKTSGGRSSVTPWGKPTK